MGCDIHAYPERRDGNKWIALYGEAFDWRAYGLYGFLAGVRNYSDVPPIAPQRGVPEDMSPQVAEEYYDWGSDRHSPSWLSMDELLSFDYDQPVEDRRVTRQLGPNLFNGGSTAEPGGGRMTTFREFLGADYFKELDRLKALGAERIVFWFDN